MSKTTKDAKDRAFITGEDREGFNHSLFVQAGAGAGKTTCIVDRVINLLLHDDIKPEKLAVITYTTKAATELKDRIRFALEKACVTGSDADRTKAAEQLDALSKAKISTVHSFCLDLLREYPVEFGVDPASKIADERKTELIQNEVQRLFYDAEAKEDPAYQVPLAAKAELSETFPNAISDIDLFSFLSVLYQNRELTPRELKAEDPAALKRCEEAAEELLKRIVTAVLITAEKEIEDESDKLYKARPALIKHFNSHGITDPKKSDFTSLREHVLSLGKAPYLELGRQGSYKDPKFIKGYKDTIKELNKCIQTYGRAIVVSAYNLILKIYPAYSGLYDVFKREHHLLDFADCLILLRNGLRDNVFLKDSLQARFDVIIVDEFQDSDPLQSEILFHLAATEAKAKTPWEKQAIVPGKLVFMGDPKQSIYGFARADISIYLKVMELVVKQFPEGARTLSENFRSQPGIVEFVNEHFAQIIKPNKEQPLASPKYEAMHAFKEKKTPKDPNVQILSLNLSLKSDSPASDGFGARGQMLVDEERSREAWLVTQFIKDEIDKKHAQPGDFLILFRKAGGMADYEWALEKRGIPHINTNTSTFLQVPEVLSLISVIGILVHPGNGHYLYSALRSRYFNYSDSEIRTLFDKAEGEPSLDKFAKSDPRLAPLASLAREPHSLSVRLEKACELLGIYSNAQALGEETVLSHVTNLLEILKAELELSHHNEKETLDALLGGALKSNNYFYNTEKEMEEEKLLLQTATPSKVRLMTIHSAKGLESRYVILAMPGTDGMTDAEVIIDREKGEIIPVECKLQRQSLAEHPQLLKDVDKEVIFKEEEEKRVLYVAATRPEEKLFIILHSGKPTGTFLSPLTECLNPKTPKIDLDLSDDYRKRHTLHSNPKAPATATITAYALAQDRKKACDAIGNRGPRSQAVTVSLQAEAEEVFKNNVDGRARGKEFGTLVHAVMEWICTRAGAKLKTNTDEVKAKLERLNQEAYGFEDGELKDCIAALGRFLSSELYSKIMSAKEIYSEVPFQVSGQVHGIIDLAYLDDAGLHIVDWKSDTFSSDARRELVGRFYEKQISAYSRALGEQLGRKVASSSCVYLLGSENI